jgi:uncharacterized protein
MSCQERAVTFSCQGEQLVGVLATPTDATRATDVGVLVVVGGPQYRAGAHRQFVQLARALAAAGHSVLRFDVRGMGDSTGTKRSFEELSDDVRAGVDALQAHAPACRRLALMGLCDGASAALLYVHDTFDRRVDALCLLNPWLRSEETLARTHVRHYYLQRVASAEFWRKLLGGGVGIAALKGFVRTVGYSLRAGAVVAAGTQEGRDGEDFRSAMRKGLEHFPGSVLLALSSDDLTAQEFAGAAAASPDWRKALGRHQVQRMMLEAADHTLSGTAARQLFEAGVLRWLGELPAHHAG